MLSTLLLTFIHYDIGKARVGIGPDETAYTRDLKFTIPIWLTIFGHGLALRLEPKAGLDLHTLKKRRRP